MVIVFDVNGTLLDTHALAPTLRRLFGAKYSVREWFDEVIQYAMATTLSRSYREFGDIALDVLAMAATARGTRLNPNHLSAVKYALQTLPPFDDVKPALKRLRKAGLRMAALSNSATEALRKQLENARLDEFFEQIISVSAVERFKPAPEPYAAAAAAMGVRTNNLLMVAAHPWDLMGARSAGCRTAFVARPGKSLYPGAPTPDHVAKDLRDLAGQLRNSDFAAMPSADGKRSSATSVLGGAVVSAIGLLVLQRARNGARYESSTAQSGGGSFMGGSDERLRPLHASAGEMEQRR